MAQHAWPDVTREDLGFRTIHPEKGSLVTSGQFLSKKKCMNIGTWSHSVNSEDFLIAEASDVEILQRSCDDHGCEGPAGGHGADDQWRQAQTTGELRYTVKRF